MLLWLALLAAPPTVVLVAGAPPGPDAARIEKARDGLRKRFRLVVVQREVLEGYAAPPSPEEMTRDALERAHQRMRRFDLAGVRQALLEAQQASARLLPTDEGRRLAALVALREAELAMVAHDHAGERRAAAYALSIEPTLAPDPRLEPPPVVAEIAHMRQALARLARVRLHVETAPPGARVVAGAHAIGTAPLELEVAPGPLVVWAARDGSVPRALWTEARAGATLTIELEPLGDAARLRPLVSTLRQTAADHRRGAALALADALGVDAVAVLEADAPAPVIYQRRIVQPEPAPLPSPALTQSLPETTPTPVTATAPFYKRAWFWAVIGGVAVASAGMAAIYYFSQPETVSYTCCR